jgi:hypothetical protein
MRRELPGASAVWGGIALDRNDLGKAQECFDGALQPDGIAERWTVMVNNT